MRIFAENDADTVFANRLNNAKAEINSLDEKYLSQSDDEDLAYRILKSVRVDPLHIRFDDAHISTYEQMIPAERHPGTFFVAPGERYKRQIIKYHLPFDGDPGLLKCIPNPRLLWSTDVEVCEHEITIDLINWSGKPEDVKGEAGRIFENIRKQYANLAKQVDTFNTSAQSQIIQMLAERRENLKKDNDFVNALGLPVKKDISSFSTIPMQQNTQPEQPAQSAPPDTDISWDVFISHASEDKEDFVRDLAAALGEQGLKIWYDENTLKLGDSLRRSIDNGLAKSRFGIVVLSNNFFNKEWPQRELDGLVTKEISSGKIILPIWHEVTKEEVANFSPILADRLAVSSDKGTEYVVNEIMNVVNSN